MSEVDRSRQHSPNATATDIQSVRSRLVDRGLIYITFLLPLSVGLSLYCAFEHGWHNIHFFNVGISILLVTGAAFKKRLSYRVRAGLLLGFTLIVGVVGLPTFGVVGAAPIALAAFAMMVTIAFGTRAGLIACAIDLVILAVTGAVVTSGSITFFFDIGEYATSMAAWSLMTAAFFLLLPVIILALGAVHTHLVTSLSGLRESEAALAQAQEIAHIGNWKWNLETGEMIWSDEVFRLLGYQPQEAKPTLDLAFDPIHPEDRDRVRKTIEEALKTKTGYNLEYRLLLPDDQTRSLASIVEVKKDDSGEVAWLYGTLQDITERKRAETEQRASEERATALLDAIPDLMFRMDRHGVFLDYRAEKSDLYIQNGTIIGKRCRDLMPPEFSDLIDQMIKLSLDSGNMQTFEYKLPMPERGLVDYEARMVKSGDDEVTTIVRDVTERKRAEENLKKIEWMLSKGGEQTHGSSGAAGQLGQSYGDLTELNTSGVILKSLGKDLLVQIADDYICMLGSSSAIYEANGDYALGIFASKWCSLLDDSSRKLCNTHDNRKALGCGKWRCHESCWNEASKASIEKGEPVDIECAGGIRLYSVPIRVGREIVGSMNFGYGDPPRDVQKLQRLSAEYGIDLNTLIETANSHATRPAFVVEIAKTRLQTSARLIGEIVERKQAEEEREKFLHDRGERVKELQCMYGVSESIRTRTTLEEMFQDIADLIPPGWHYPEITRGKVIFDGKEYVSEPFEETRWKQSSDIVVNGESHGSIEVYYLEECSELDEGPFMTEERNLIDGIARSISEATKRRRAEEALRDSEKKHRGLIESLPQRIFHKDANQVYVSCNEHFARDLGIAPDEIAGKTDFDFYPRELAEKYREEDQWVMKLGQTEEIEESSIKDGQEQFVQTVKTPLTDDSGNVTGILGIYWDITERKRAEEALRESERRLSSHLQNTPVAAIEWNIDFEVVEWNAAAEKVFGYTRDEALGRHAAGLIVPESARKHVDKVWNDLLENAGGFHSTNENFTKDGRTIVCEWNNTPLVDKSGKVCGVASLVQDITERKQAKKALQESEEKYRQLFTCESDAVLVFDAETRQFLEVNDAAIQLYGYNREEFLQLKHIDITAEEEASEKSIEQTLKEGIIRLPLRYHKKKDGTVFPVEISGSTFSLKGRTMMCGIARDITVRKHAEEALRGSEERFRGLAEMLPGAVFETDQDLIITYANRRAFELFGYSAKDLKRGLSGFDMIVPDERERAKADVAMRQLGKEPGTSEYQAMRKDGSTFPVLFLANTIMQEGVMVGIRGIILDITETKRLQALESRAARLETAGMIAGQVAHDFNNLLAPLMAYPDFIREDLPKDHPALAYIDDIENSAKQIAEINQQLLTLGRRGHYNQEGLNMNAIIHQAVRELSPLPKTLTIETELDEHLLSFKGGGSQIHRILSNLLSNAMEAMQDIGQIHIKTECHYADDVAIAFGRVPKGEYVKLTLSDTGCGIPDDILQSVFDPFFTSKTTDKKRGSGLGLSVVDAVVKDHQGFLDLTTKVGVGTSFYLYFPVTREDLGEEEAVLLAGGTERILIVDDDEIQREVSQHVMEKLGYTVSSVDSGEQAIEFIRRNQQDIIILDMVMPGGIDGVETYRGMLEINPHQKAIILSGYSESNRVLEAQKLGAGAFVKKPVTKRTIAAAVRTELDRMAQAAS